MNEKKKKTDTDSDIASDRMDRFMDDAESVKYQVIEYGPNSPNSARPGQSPAGGEPTLKKVKK